MADSWIARILRTIRVLPLDNGKDPYHFQSSPKANEHRKLKAEYAESSLHREPETFILYRIIGNDLVPRHVKGQSKENLRFIIDNEPEFDACEKKFILNRIFDKIEESEIIELLKSQKKPYLRIPFDWNEYTRIPWDFECFENPGFLFCKEYSELSAYERTRAEVACRRLKNNYVMNNNGARNAALLDGRARAKWILPWDGNCYLTQEGWAHLEKAIRARPFLKYFIVPMARITDNQALLDDNFAPQAKDEPQILFRSDATEMFDHEVPYGRRPKVELFWRLGVPGSWDNWADDPWDLPRPLASPEAHQFGRAGWVARLYSGAGHLEKRGLRLRGEARAHAIISTIDMLDCSILSNNLQASPLLCYDDHRLESAAKARRASPLGAVVQKMRQRAEEALLRGPYSVVDKTSLPPSGDLHDYWHPAPYFWPNPHTPDGLPYIKIDGKRSPGTGLYDPGSEKYDRTRLQRLFDDATTLALAWRITEDTRYAEHGAALVRHWFLNPSTRMNPHMMFAQVRLGHNDNQGYSTGIIEAKDFYFFLDGIRLLERSSSLNPVESNALKEWLRTYLEWLLTSTQGIQECRTKNNHGTLFDLQVAAIAAYVADFQTLLSALRRAHGRLLEQFEPDGSQPHELARTITQHYCCFNLQSWINLADIAAACGHDLWSFNDSKGRSLKRALEWLLNLSSEAEWPYPQSEPFDRERFLPVFVSYSDHYGELPNIQFSKDRYAIKPIFHPHDGVRPFWMFGGGSTDVSQ